MQNCRLILCWITTGVVCKRIDSSTLTCLATSLRKATPLSKFSKTTDPYFLTSGTGRIRKVTSVMTPRMPSDPNMKCWMSGPIEFRGPCIHTCMYMHDQASLVPRPFPSFSKFHTETLKNWEWAWGRG